MVIGDYVDPILFIFIDRPVLPHFRGVSLTEFGYSKDSTFSVSVALVSMVAISPPSDLQLGNLNRHKLGGGNSGQAVPRLLKAPLIKTNVQITY